jgi:cysteine-rich repeat protein
MASTETTTTTFDPSTSTAITVTTGDTDETTTTSDTDTSTGTTDATTGVVILCPNGVVDPGEECDDDNGIDTDDCTNACLLPICGDLILHAGVEDCDDGNDIDTDACLPTCVDASCGDGFVQAGVEGCDDGNMVNDDACTNACVPAMCGDGIVQAPEECDDQNPDNTDDCLDVCTGAVCGDGFIQAGVDTCDDAGFSPTCDDDCTPAMCGDGLINPVAGEDCDDAVETPQCDSDCTDPMCGDGTVNMAFGEMCDDAGESPTCDDDCSPASCGDGNANAAAGEECDDGGPSGTCDADCTVAACGDGVLNAVAGEVCDDGNVIEGDGCSSMCQPHKVVFTTSTLFDGNLGGLAGADMKCQAAADAASLPGTYLAWVSNAMGSPATRFTKSMIPYVRRDGTKVADNWNDLIDGSLDAPITRTEFNMAPPVGTATCPLNFPDAQPTVKGLTITNTGTNGTEFNNGFSCLDWTTNSANNSTGGGHWSSTNGKWTTLVCIYGCHQKESLYCFQQ